MAKLFTIREIEQVSDYIIKINLGVSHDECPELTHIVYFSIYEVYNKTKEELKELIKQRINYEDLSFKRTQTWLEMVKPFIDKEGSEL